MKACNVGATSRLVLHVLARRQQTDINLVMVFGVLTSGQTRELCEKQEKYFKGNVVTFTVQSLILFLYPVDLLTFSERY